MDTTIEDFAKFAAGCIRGARLSRRSHEELLRVQAPITTATQFPPLQPERPQAQRRRDLAAGLGVILFDGPQGPRFFKGGHNDSTGNTWVCVGRGAALHRAARQRRARRGRFPAAGAPRTR